MENGKLDGKIAVKGTTMRGNMNSRLPKLRAFKRAPALGLSQWENGNLTTNLAETKDTNGAFLLVEAMLAPGTEPSTASPYYSSMFNTASAMTKDSRRFTCPSHLSAVLTLLGKQNACRP